MVVDGWDGNEMREIVDDNLINFMFHSHFSIISSLVPLWSRQIPYTMAKFYFFEKVIKSLFSSNLPSLFISLFISLSLNLPSHHLSSYFSFLKRWLRFFTHMYSKLPRTLTRKVRWDYKMVDDEMRWLENYQIFHVLSSSSSWL